MTSENEDPLTDEVEEKTRGELNDEDEHVHGDESIVQKRKDAETEAVEEREEEEEQAEDDDDDETPATDGGEDEEEDQNQYGGGDGAESAVEQTERVDANDEDGERSDGVSAEDERGGGSSQAERSDGETIPHTSEEQEEESPRDEGA